MNFSPVLSYCTNVLRGLSVIAEFLLLLEMCANVVFLECAIVPYRPLLCSAPNRQGIKR